MGRSKFDQELGQMEDDDLASKRMAICHKCDKYTVNSILPDICGVCKCVLRIKTLFPSQKCPIGKW